VSPKSISNPILRGSNPDPSIVRVGGDYYIATSTFEWYPGVQIHHSRDLINWRLLTRPLDSDRLVDLRGVPNSGGIWAPCLTWSGGLFWLCFTIVYSVNGPTKDCRNYVTTAETISGPWSDPVYLNSSGFDPSLFHDDDGKKWLVNMVWDHRATQNPFHGIRLQEYSPGLAKLVGSPRDIFCGTALGRTEGPHLYKRRGYYYLMTAEGGTGFEHAVTLARSRMIEGPYEVHPRNPVLTSWRKPHLPLQKAGHADLVETENGDWFLAHLCARPLPETGRCVLGRETALQAVEWRSDGWLYLKPGGNDPQLEVASPAPAAMVARPSRERDDFEGECLDGAFQSLRVPLTRENHSLSERKGFLRLRGGESPSSQFTQSLVARRREDFDCVATTCLEFKPESFMEMAGLICFYSTKLFHYLCMSHDERFGECLYIYSVDNAQVRFPLGERQVIPLAGATRVHLRAEFHHAVLRFHYSIDGVAWNAIGGSLDASILSDDYGNEWGFTGTFIGMACQDLSGGRRCADFDYFEYVRA
jgi:xylan 1,4-beta-xylosidase